MATKKGAVQAKQQATANPASSSTTKSANMNSAISASAPSRGSMTANGSASALQFLKARWKAVEIAANDSSIAASEKPEIHREKSVNPRTASPLSNPQQQQLQPQQQQQQQQQKGANQPKGGSPWNRKH